MYASLCCSSHFSFSSGDPKRITFHIEIFFRDDDWNVDDPVGEVLEIRGASQYSLKNIPARVTQSSSSSSRVRLLVFFPTNPDPDYTDITSPQIYLYIYNVGKRDVTCLPTMMSRAHHSAPFILGFGCPSRNMPCARSSLEIIRKISIENNPKKVGRRNVQQSPYHRSTT